MSGIRKQAQTGPLIANRLMEDTQPNEVRLSRKGSTNIPRVRTSHPVHIPYGGYGSRPSKRLRWQPPAPRAPLPGIPSSKTDKALGPNLVEVEVPLPRECSLVAPGSHNARKRWIGDQKYHLWTDRHLSVVSFRYSDNSVLFTCRVQLATQFAAHHARGYSEPRVLLPPTKFVLSSTQTVQRRGRTVLSMSA